MWICSKPYFPQWEKEETRSCPLARLLPQVPATLARCQPKLHISWITELGHWARLSHAGAPDPLTIERAAQSNGPAAPVWCWIPVSALHSPSQTDSLFSSNHTGVSLLQSQLRSAQWAWAMPLPRDIGRRQFCDIGRRQFLRAYSFLKSLGDF